MTEFIFPEPVDHEIDLVALPTRGQIDAATERVRGRITLGIPTPALISSATAALDDDLRRFVDATSDSTFHLVLIACSFRDGEGGMLEEATVYVDLGRADDIAVPQPIAWSVQPRRVDTLVEVATRVRVDASARILGAGAEETRTAQIERPFLEAFGEFEPGVSWVFRRTAQREISGAHRLTLVVRAPAGVDCSGEVRVTAAIAQRRFGFRRAQVDGDAAWSRFALPSSS